MYQKMKHHVANALPALQSKNYRLLFIGQGISLVGSWMQMVADQWLIYPTLTNNKAMLGVISAISFFPTIALLLFAGVMVDRWNKRKAFFLFQVLYMILALIMFGLVLTHTVAIWHVMVIACIGGIIMAFESPTRQAFTVELVDRQHISSATSLSSVVFNVARALGPALAGTIIAAVGIASAYLINALSFLAVMASLYFMKFKEQVPEEKSTVGIWSGLKDGLAYVRKQKMITMLLCITSGWTFTTMFLSTLFPIYANDIFNVGEKGFGLLQSFLGLGAITGGLFFTSLHKRKIPIKKLIIFTSSVYVLCMLLFAMSSVFFISLIIVMFAGWAMTTTFASVNTYIQLMTPKIYQGRMISFYSLMMIGGMPFGALTAGLMANHFGTKGATIIGAIFLTISIGIIMTVYRNTIEEKAV